MSNFIALFFPCCDSGRKVEAAESNCSSSAPTHIITALVVGIILGAGSAAAAYFLTPQVILWTAIAGGGGFLLTTLITYVALRCCYGKSGPVESDEGGKAIGKIKELIPVNQRKLFTLMGMLNPNFSETMRERGTVYYDPSNELPIPLARLYQGILMQMPANHENREILLDLFVAELLTIYIENEKGINIYLSALDPKIVQMLGDKVPAGDPKHSLKSAQLPSYLRSYGKVNNRHDFQTVQNRAEIVRQLNQHVKEGYFRHFYFGASLDDGGCLFHTMAQELSALFKMEITEKTLRMQCHDYMVKLNDVGCESRWKKSNDREDPEKTLRPWPANDFNTTTEDYQSKIEEGQWSSRDILEKNSKDIPTWGDTSIHGRIIAELYGVEIRLYEALTEKIEGQEGHFDEYGLWVGATYKTERYKSDGTTIGPYVGEDRITLSDIGYEAVPPVVGALHIASMSNHFFPIWVV